MYVEASQFPLRDVSRIFILVLCRDLSTRGYFHQADSADIHGARLIGRFLQSTLPECMTRVHSVVDGNVHRGPALAAALISIIRSLPPNRNQGNSIGNDDRIKACARPSRAPAQACPSEAQGWPRRISWPALDDPGQPRRPKRAPESIQKTLEGIREPLPRTPWPFANQGTTIYRPHQTAFQAQAEAYTLRV